MRIPLDIIYHSRFLDFRLGRNFQQRSRECRPPLRGGRLPGKAPYEKLGIGGRNDELKLCGKPSAVNLYKVKSICHIEKIIRRYSKRFLIFRWTSSARFFSSPPPTSLPPSLRLPPRYFSKCQQKKAAKSRGICPFFSLLTIFFLLP